jgi:hypothetical protein
MGARKKQHRPGVDGRDKPGQDGLLEICDTVSARTLRDPQKTTAAKIIDRHRFSRRSNTKFRSD